MKPVQTGTKKGAAHPLIVGSIVSAASLRREVRRRGREYDIAEIRLDLIGDDSLVTSAARAMQRTGTPVLLTIRSRREGGGWKGSEAERSALYGEHLGDVAVIDVETRSPIFKKLCARAHEAGCMVIGSFHDFKRTPSLERLAAVVRKARGDGADIVKIATRVVRKQDVAILFKLLQMRGDAPMCVIGMGALGRATRVSLPCAGSCLTYGSLGKSAAPGQIACRVLARRLAECGCRRS